MKKIIEGKSYNTETALVVCELPYQCHKSDFGYHETYLYRTKKGRFFIAGSGLSLVSREDARSYMEARIADEAIFVSAGFEVKEG